MEPKQSYKENNYPYYHQVIGNDISNTWHDAAQKELGGDWQMPTKEEWHELLFSTEHEWVSIHDRQGYLFTAKNGSRLFFPANGYAYDQNVDTPDEGYYWTSTFSNIDSLSFNQPSILNVLRMFILSNYSTRISYSSTIRINIFRYY